MLTTNVLIIKIIDFGNIVDSDEVAHHDEPPHLDLQCLPSQKDTLLAKHSLKPMMCTFWGIMCYLGQIWYFLFAIKVLFHCIDKKNMRAGRQRTWTLMN